jgi:hypothetical protein
LNGELIELSPFKIFLAQLHGSYAAIKGCTNDIQKRSTGSLLTISDEIETEINQG